MVYAAPVLERSRQMSCDIDLVHLARQTAGDRLLEREILGLFRDQCVRLTAAITADGDTRASRIAAHSLTGAARAVGAFKVADFAQAVETAPHDAFAVAAADLAAAAEDARRLVERLLNGA